MVLGTCLNKQFLIHPPPNLHAERFGWARAEPGISLGCHAEMLKARNGWNRTRQEVKQPTEFLMSPYAEATQGPLRKPLIYKSLS